MLKKTVMYNKMRYIRVIMHISRSGGGLQDRRARKILVDMCDAGVLMKVGATSNLKYVLKI